MLSSISQLLYYGGVMMGDTTVILRKGEDVPVSQSENYEAELRRLLFCDTIVAAREYAEDRCILGMLAKLARREGTAIGELAQQALRYPVVLAELRESIVTAPSSECAATRIQALFLQIASKECEFGLQRMIGEIMRDAAAHEPEGSRMRFVAEEFLRCVAKIKEGASSACPSKGRLPSTVWAVQFLCSGAYSIPNFMDWMGMQPRDDLRSIVDLLRERMQKRDYGWELAQTVLRCLEP